MIVVSEGLDHGNLLALGGHDSPHQYAQQERRNAQEQGRQHHGGNAQLGNFLAQHAVGDDIMPVVCAQATIAGQQQVDLLDHARGHGIVLQAKQRRVESAVHGKGVGQGPAVHPDHGKTLVVGQQIPRGYLVDERW